jgi:hypothetical protein
VILTTECCALGEGAITTYFKHLTFDTAGLRGAQTHDLLDAKREHYHKATAISEETKMVEMHNWCIKIGIV